MKRLKLYFDKDKETQWLNDMARRGWAAESFFGGVFSLEPCGPGEYLYQIDIVPKGQAEKEFREFMEQMDVELVYRWFWWVTLRRRSSLGEFVMYTDTASRTRYYRKIAGILLTMVLILSVFVLGSGIVAIAEKDAFKIVISVLEAGIVLVLLRTLLSYCRKIKKLQQGGDL